MKEYIGYLLAVLILLFYIFSSSLNMRLDFIAFQKNYQDTQNTVIQAIQQLNTSMQELNKRVGTLEKLPVPAEVKK